MENAVFGPAGILLPRGGTDLEKWAVLACDQFTSAPEYWQDVQNFVGNAPSTLQLVLPEVYLEAPDVDARIASIHAAMQAYLEAGLFTQVEGFVYVERETGDGRLRQGLVGCVDLEAYDFAEEGNTAQIRPTEGTVVERIPPRLAVRRGAALETPHILMLADDPAGTVIEPIAEKKTSLRPLYDTPLMLQGGRVRGWAVTRQQDIDAIWKAIAALGDEAAFQKRYGAPQGAAAFTFAVGDGNHSLATAKAFWEETKAALAPQQRAGHPARYCLVELENIQSPAIAVEPIHRAVFNADAASLLRAAALFAAAKDAALVPGSRGGQVFRVLHTGGERVIGVQNSPWPLAVASLDAFLDAYRIDHPELRVDYVHGEEELRRLVAERGALGIAMPPIAKQDLFRGVALGGVLPRKTFSMGEAVHKRYYMECRKIVL